MKVFHNRLHWSHDRVLTGDRLRPDLLSPCRTRRSRLLSQQAQCSFEVPIAYRGEDFLERLPCIFPSREPPFGRPLREQLTHRRWASLPRLLQSNRESLIRIQRAIVEGLGRFPPGRVCMRSEILFSILSL